MRLIIINKDRFNTPFLGDWNARDGEWPDGSWRPQFLKATYGDFSVTVIVNTLIDGLHSISFSHPKPKVKRELRNFDLKDGTLDDALRAADEYAAEHFPKLQTTPSRAWNNKTPFLGTWISTGIPSIGRGMGNHTLYKVERGTLSVELRPEEKGRAHRFTVWDDGVMVHSEGIVKGGLKKAALVADQWAQNYVEGN